ncbi:hypothetical protein Micbo1qcDRAFT_155194 [Microdochium bolleyi]|uniref:Uncharacterized protein n=1 Tax=Microdochium bolleyi TaxID=196109 RepID=A0A136JHI5_9PEZI|nr:hypothetical protein Micbo1qcDRAFT_155194 [Microdochium bolleyi]
MKPTTPGRVVAFSRNVVFPPAGHAPEQPATGTMPPAPQDNASRHVFLQPPPAILQPRAPSQIDQENALRSKSAANTAATRAQRPQQDTLPHVGSVASGSKSAQLNSFPQPKAFAVSGDTWTKSHWVRFDEILQLRRKNPALFRRDHPDASLPGDDARDPVDCNDNPDSDEDARSHTSSARSSSKILGKQISGQGESIVVEPWHLEVVNAFMQELDPCPWDERVLAKRLFALIVGEERRKHASFNSGAAKRRGPAGLRAELGPRHR